jgi:hypothetical protein
MQLSSTTPCAPLRKHAARTDGKAKRLEARQMTTTIVIVQAAADIPPIVFDLAKVKNAGNCGAGAPDAIVICGRHGQSLPEPSATDNDVADLLPKAEFKLFGKVRAMVHGDQDKIGGFSSNAAKVKITVPF